MAGSGGSISMRLIIGFLILLLVFGSAILLTLYHLERVRRVGEEIRLRQEVQREAQTLATAAEQLFLQQREFIESDPVDFSRQEEFRRTYRAMGNLLTSLRNRPVDGRERTYLQELVDATIQLRDLFEDKIVPTRMAVQEGTASPQELADLEEQSREITERMHALNEELAASFDIRTRTAEDHAAAAWAISTAVAKITFPAALLIGLLVVYYTHRSITAPVSELVRGTQELAAGRFSGAIHVTASGEFRELADSFNRMARDLQTNQQRLIEAEKLATVGRLAAGLAHEINNPIAVILGYSQMLVSDAPDGSAEKEQLESIQQEARQCKSIIDGLLDLSRPTDTMVGEAVNPNEVMTEVLNVVHALSLAENVEVETSVVDRAVYLSANRSQLRQTALNIIRNALEALADVDSPKLEVLGYIRPREKLDNRLLEDCSPEAESFLVLVFSDNGPGIAPEHKRSLFEPFFTTKADGVGLGLAICYNMVRAHGGFIDVQTSSAEGTTFTVGLPLGEE